MRRARELLAVASGGISPSPSPLALGEHGLSKQAARSADTPVEETMRLLDWPALSAQVARQASTDMADRRMRQVGGMHIPTSRAESERLLMLTRAVHYLYFTLMKPIDFRGVCALQEVVVQAEKGVLLTAAELRRVADTLAAVRRIRRFIDAEQDERVLVLTKLVADVRTYPEVESRIKKLIDDFS